MEEGYGSGFGTITLNANLTIGSDGMSLDSGTFGGNGQLFDSGPTGLAAGIMVVGTGGR